MTVSIALGQDKTPMDLDMPVGTSGQDLTSVGALCPRAQTVALRTPTSKTFLLLAE